MSIKYMSQVWTLDLGTGEKARAQKLVLMALADHADDQGITYPSAEYIGWKTDYCARSVKRILAQLVSDGLIRIAKQHTPTTPRKYRLTLAGAPTKSPYQRRPSGRGYYEHLDDEDEITDAVPHSADEIEGVTSDVGVTYNARGVTYSAPRGDTAMSPEPSLNPKPQPPIKSPLCGKSLRDDSAMAQDASNAVNNSFPPVEVVEFDDLKPALSDAEAFELDARRNSRTEYAPAVATPNDARREFGEQVAPEIARAYGLEPDAKISRSVAYRIFDGDKHARNPEDVVRAIRAIPKKDLGDTPYYLLSKIAVAVGKRKKVLRFANV